MSTWEKANKNLSDIRDVENLCDRKSASLKNEIDGFLQDVDRSVKVLQFTEPTVGTLPQFVQRNSDAARVAERNFIGRAKECAEIKARVKTASAAVKENFSQAVIRARSQGLYFD